MNASLTKYQSIIHITLKSRLTYAWDFLGSGFFMIVVMFVFVKLWQTTFNAQPTIENFSLAQMIWYLLGTELIIMSMSPVHRVIEREIKEGDVAVRLNKPYSFFLFHYSQFLGEQMVKAMILLVIGGTVTYSLVGAINFSIYSIPALMISLLLASLSNFVYGYLIGIAAFWFEDISGLYFILDRIKWLLGGFLLPISLFPEPLKTIVQYLPFQYFIYAPARLIVDFSWKHWLQVVSIQILIAAIFIGLALFVYRCGIKKLNVNGG